MPCAQRQPRGEQRACRGELGAPRHPPADGKADLALDRRRHPAGDDLRRHRPDHARRSARRAGAAPAPGAASRPISPRSRRASIRARYLPIGKRWLGGEAWRRSRDGGRSARRHRRIHAASRPAVASGRPVGPAAPLASSPPACTSALWTPASQSRQRRSPWISAHCSHGRFRRHQPHGAGDRRADDAGLSDDAAARPGRHRRGRPISATPRCSAAWPPARSFSTSSSPPSISCAPAPPASSRRRSGAATRRRSRRCCCAPSTSRWSPASRWPLLAPLVAVGGRLVHGRRAARRRGDGHLCPHPAARRARSRSINYAVLGYVLGRGEGRLGLLLQLVLNGANIAACILLGLKLGWGVPASPGRTVCGETIAACRRPGDHPGQPLPQRAAALSRRRVIRSPRRCWR